MGAAKEHPYEYLAASALAASINYPLWRASAISQSGFTVIRSGVLANVPPSISPYVYAFAPPYKGMAGVIFGMTWARGFIFWGSDRGRDFILEHKLLGERFEPIFANVIPPLLVSTFVQCVNQPIVRASITLQNPQSGLTNTVESVKHIYKNFGVKGLWHGTSAGVLKTVPKYCTAVFIKDWMEEVLPQAEQSSPSYETDKLLRSAIKSACAGVAGAALTNPLDVIRNEMFKTNKPLVETVRHLYDEMGYRFLVRGMGKNMIAVAIPVGCTIFFTDALIQFSASSSS